MFEPSAQAAQQQAAPSQDRARLVYDANVILGARQLTGTPVSIFTVPAQSTLIMKNFTIFNIDSTDHVATVRLVPFGGDITNDAYTYWENSVPARRQLGSAYEEVLTAGYQIVAYGAVAAQLNIKINGAVLVSQ